MISLSVRSCLSTRVMHSTTLLLPRTVTSLECSAPLCDERCADVDCWVIRAARLAKEEEEREEDEEEDLAVTN